MKFSLVLVAYLAGLAVAQTSTASSHSPVPTANVPPCVQQCSEQAAQTAGCTTDVEDPSCICKNPGFLPAVEPCIHANCTEADHQAAMSIFQTICGPLPSHSGTNASSSVAPATNTAPLSSSLGTSRTRVPTSATPSGTNSSNAAMAGLNFNVGAGAMWSALLVGGAVIAQAVL